MIQEDKELLLKDLCARLPYGVKVMTQEDKELLLKDLCARLPYGVKVQDELGRINKLVIGNADVIRLYYNDFSIYNEQQISLPLLRPMSSMTKEEEKEFCKIEGRVDFLCKYIKLTFSVDELDWFHKHHFDYRGLIEKGLAVEALEGMYK